MKRYINKAVVVLLALLTLSVSSFAQPTEASYSEHVLEQGLKAFPIYLKSDYQGIVESTIYNIVLLKKYFPNANYKTLVDDLNSVSQENDSPAIRYKAHLASMYLTYGSNIEVNTANTGFDHEKVFRQLAEQLEKKLLVSNTNE